MITYLVEVFAAPAWVWTRSCGILRGLFGLLGMIITTYNTAAANAAAVWLSGVVWIVMAGLWLISKERGGSVIVYAVC